MILERNEKRDDETVAIGGTVRCDTFKRRCTRSRGEASLVSRVIPVSFVSAPKERNGVSLTDRGRGQYGRHLFLYSPRVGTVSFSALVSRHSENPQRSLFYACLNM